MKSNEKDINAHSKAKATPIAADPEKIIRNDPKDLKNESVCAVTDLECKKQEDFSTM